jgi:phospholipase/lecithinase/hemolysin
MAQNTSLNFGAIYAFGDSLSDAGNLSLTTAELGTATPQSPYFQESYKVPILGTVTADVFSNGPTWVQDLAQYLGLGTLQPSVPYLTPFVSDPSNGLDFAFGGAETGDTPQNKTESDLTAISLPSQLVQFQTLEEQPASNALYTLSIGSNDVLDVLANTALTAQQQTTDINDAVANEITFINGLAKDGAKNLVVLGVPDLGKTPDVIDGLANGTGVTSPMFEALATALSSEYNSDLNLQLDGVASGDKLNITYVNAFQLIDDAVADPAPYGLTNVTSPVWSGTYVGGSTGTLAATGSAQNAYLFFDHLHPTETGEQAVASLAEAALTACYAAGTKIATERGDVAVEALQPGDRVVLAEGGWAPVVWLGHRRVFCRSHLRPSDVQPVRIAAHAFGLGRPARDLLLSPDHAVFVGGVLIPIRYLLNGATVRQEDVAAVTYWHVELTAHAALLAEGLPAESYLDTGNRAAFANGGVVAWAHPDFARATWEARSFAPLVTAGPVRDTIYRQLLAQAFALGWRTYDAGGGASAWLAPHDRMTGTD